MESKKLTRKQIRNINKELKNAEINVEETPKCSHENLKKVATDSLWYQCSECKAIFFIFGCVLYRKNLLKKDIDEILEKAED